MVIVAHPDDADFGPAATAARWIDQGSTGWLVCCTSGDAGGEDPDADPLDLAALREREQRAAADVVGYAYAGPWRTRAAYRFAVETTVYLDRNRTGHGLGRALYGRLLADLRELGFRCAMGGIALPNDASVALHERMGFVKVAHFREVGFKFNRWIDVAYWQRAL